MTKRYHKDNAIQGTKMTDILTTFVLNPLPFAKKVLSYTYGNALVLDYYGNIFTSVSLGIDSRNDLIDWVKIFYDPNFGAKGQWTDINVSHTFNEDWKNPPHMWGLDLYGQAVKIDLPPLLERIYLDNP